MQMGRGPASCRHISFPLCQRLAMPFFATRRALSGGSFNHNPASLTRYVDVPAGTTPGKDHCIDRDTWLARVNAQAAARQILVFVHGFNTEQPEMLARMGKVENNLATAGWPGLVVAFDWPSDGTVWAYNRDRTDAKKVAPNLVTDLIAPLKNLRPQPKVHMLCHSMGCYLTLRGFAGVGDSGAPGTSPWGVDEISLVAGDADKPWLESGAWGALVLDRRSTRVTNYYSTFDRVLDLSENIIHGQERTGRSGLPVSIPASFNDVYCGQQYQDKVPSSGKTFRGSHTWYFDDAVFYQDLKLTMDGADPLNRPTRRPTVGSSDLALLT